MLVLGLVAAYWIAYRPLPQTSGQIAAPISARATVERDALGVPHIAAANWEDAIFLQGYVTAQDRLWQMDALRRLAAGELSEVLGPSTLELDREARRLRMRRIAEEHDRTLPPADRAVLAAYARGVNYFIETHRGRLPLEFTLLRYDPRPWTHRGQPAVRLADVSQPDHHLAGRTAEDDDAGERRSGQGECSCFPRAPEPSFSRARTPG